MNSKVSWALIAFVLSGPLPGHTDDKRRTAEAPDSKSRPEPAPKAARLRPWQPVDASFNGCSEGFCGSRGQNSRAVVQPGAKIGDYTYCLISGAVFQIKESHFHAELHGKTVYFCCEGCARYFAANREKVLAQRRLPL